MKEESKANKRYACQVADRSTEWPKISENTAVFDSVIANLTPVNFIYTVDDITYNLICLSRVCFV